MLLAHSCNIGLEQKSDIGSISFIHKYTPCLPSTSRQINPWIFIRREETISSWQWNSWNCYSLWQWRHPLTKYLPNHLRKKLEKKKTEHQPVGASSPTATAFFLSQPWTEQNAGASGGWRGWNQRTFAERLGLDDLADAPWPHPILGSQGELVPGATFQGLQPVGPLTGADGETAPLLTVILWVLQDVTWRESADGNGITNPSGNPRRNFKDLIKLEKKSHVQGNIQLSPDWKVPGNAICPLWQQLKYNFYGGFKGEKKRMDISKDPSISNNQMMNLDPLKWVVREYRSGRSDRATVIRAEEKVIKCVNKLPQRQTAIYWKLLSPW